MESRRGLLLIVNSEYVPRWQRRLCAVEFGSALAGGFVVNFLFLGVFCLFICCGVKGRAGWVALDLADCCCISSFKEGAYFLLWLRAQWLDGSVAILRSRDAATAAAAACARLQLSALLVLPPSSVRL